MVDPVFLQNYVMYVCPLRAQPRQCLPTLRAPPLAVQQSIDDLVEIIPGPLRGPVMDSLVDGRPADAQYLIDHADEYLIFNEIFQKTYVHRMVEENGDEASESDL